MDDELRLRKTQENKKQRRLLWGVLGVGLGHTYRQLPLIDHFSRTCKIGIFASLQAYDELAKRYEDSQTVRVFEVCAPYYPDNHSGIDFGNVRDLTEDQNQLHMNAQAMARADSFIGTPDLVVSDYEAISAMYAYAHDAKLITVDQQSKYLSGDFPPIEGMSYRGEYMRLNMFFPKVHRRIACSFFQVPRRRSATAEVDIFPPILRNAVLRQVNKPVQDEFLVYLSATQDYAPLLSCIDDFTTANPSARFKVYAKNITTYDSNAHIRLNEPDGEKFTQDLSTCSGIVCTAGHSLVSEAMHLGIPVLAIPRPQYEASLVAKVIHDNGFGHAQTKLSLDGLEYFTTHVDEYRRNIARDNSILLRGSSQEAIIDIIEKETQVNTKTRITDSQR